MYITTYLVVVNFLFEKKSSRKKYIYTVTLSAKTSLILP